MNNPEGVTCYSPALLALGIVRKRFVVPLGTTLYLRVLMQTLQRWGAGETWASPARDHATALRFWSDIKTVSNHWSSRNYRLSFPWATPGVRE